MLWPPSRLCRHREPRRLKDRVALQSSVFSGAPIDLLRRNDTLFDEERLERIEPARVIVLLPAGKRGCARGDLRHQSVAEGVPFVGALLVQQDRDPEGAPLPWRLEDELAVLAWQRGLL